MDHYKTANRVPKKEMIKEKQGIREEIQTKIMSNQPELAEVVR